MQLRLASCPWPGNFHMLLVQPKKEKKKTIKEKSFSNAIWYHLYVESKVWHTPTSNAIIYVESEKRTQ